MRGLRDSTGQIVINEAEAESDIRKIEQAKSKLSEAIRILNPSGIDSGRMLGDTRDALDEKLNAINKEIQMWDNRCTTVVRFIRNVVQNYKRIDREYSQRQK